MHLSFSRQVTSLILLGASLSAAAQYALPCVSVTSLRASRGHSQEQVSQVVMGTPLKVLSAESGWMKVQTPEGYEGYVIGNTLSRLTDEKLAAWQQSPRMVVKTLGQTYIYDNATRMTPDHRLSDVVPGCILVADVSDAAANGVERGPRRQAVKVTLPDGRTGYMAANELMPLDDWKSRASSLNTRQLLEAGLSLMGTPYVWGGTSTKGMDCSGFTQILYYRHGILLPRDASQQAEVGMPVFDRKGSEPLDSAFLECLEPGDLLFFGNRKTSRVTHVGLYFGDGKVLHCSGRVRVNTLLPGSADEIDAWLLSARRIDQATARKLSVEARKIYGLAPNE